MRHGELLIAGHFVGGPCDQSTGKDVVRNPFDGSIVGTVAEGAELELRGCIEAAHDAFGSWRKSSVTERKLLLFRIAELVIERKEELAELLVLEVGKPITWARAEVDRLAITFEIAADELSTWGTEKVSLRQDPRGTYCSAEFVRFPIGVIFAITPYNWPFNLAAHKIAPVLATGNTVVLKPSPMAALSTLALARLIHEAGCPPGVLNAWNGDTRHLVKALSDERISMISFTGSEEVGWGIKESYPTKRVTLELGGDAFAIVHSDADLENAVSRMASGAYGYAGQVCISVQHVLVHQSLYDQARSSLIKATIDCPFGDPRGENIVCGPLINKSALEKVTAMIEEAVSNGATILAGGGSDGNVYLPTLIENVPKTSQLFTEEVFGPVLTLAPYRSIDEVVARINASRFGIQCGVFTEDQAFVDRLFDDLVIGGIVHNDVPTLRFDAVPYGGEKRSGWGREGVRSAMIEMTTPKSLVRRMN